MAIVPRGTPQVGIPFSNPIRERKPVNRGILDEKQTPHVVNAGGVPTLVGEEVTTAKIFERPPEASGITVPADIAKERIKQRFAPVLRHATSIIPQGLRKGFGEMLVDWLLSLPGPQLEQMAAKMMRGKKVNPLTLPPGARKGTAGITLFAVQTVKMLLTSYLKVHEENKEARRKAMSPGGIILPPSMRES